jgi:UDP-glucuronate decarboxylase
MNTIIKEDIANIASRLTTWYALEGKHILITGANGFLASYLVETILYLNDTRFTKPATVVALVRNKEHAEKKFLHHKNRQDLQFLVQDVCDIIQYDGAIHIIVHAASPASPKYFGANPIGTLLPNSLGTYQLLEYARRKGTERFLFVSSAEVYGNCGDLSENIGEEMYGVLDPLNVRSCYAESKRFGETLCVSYHHHYHIPTYIVRPFHSYGPGMNLDDGRVYADFVADMVSGKNISMNSNGEAVRSFCYITDVVVAFFTVLLRGHVGEAYNIGNCEAMTSIADLADMLTKLFPEKKRTVERKKNMPAGYLRSTVKCCCPDTTKLEQLGWRAQVSLEEGFKRTVQSYE